MDSFRDAVLRPFDVVRRLRLAPDATVADVGAGAAYFTVHLAAAVPRGKVIATDLRSDLLGIVRRRSAASGLHNVEARGARRDDCGLDPRSLDLAFLCQVDHHLADRVSYFRSIVEALRSDGRMAILNFGQHYRPNALAAREIGMEITDEWWPSDDHFMMILARR